MTRRVSILVALIGIALVGFGAPSWLALGAGLVVALASGASPPPALRRLTGRTLQLGVVALGAGMNLEVVWRIGSSGALITAISLTAALGLGLALGHWLRVRGDTPLLISVGTAICGGSAIAAVASVIKPKEHEISIALAVVFVLNAVGLVLFPALGHAFGLSQPVFGRWAALAIHDTSSVVGAALAFGPTALATATAVKLARALWIAPATAVLGWRSGRRRAKVPPFIVGFLAAAALGTFVGPLHAAGALVAAGARRLFVATLFLVGAGLSRAALCESGDGR